MRAKVYLRVAPTSRGFRVQATTKPSAAPLNDAAGRIMPTIAFALVLNIAPEAFAAAEAVLAEIDVPADVPRVAVELVR